MWICQILGQKDHLLVAENKLTVTLISSYFLLFFLRGSDMKKVGAAKVIRA
jgi:hypothetical protein